MTTELRRAAGALLLPSLVFGLAACGGGGGDDGPPTTGLAGTLSVFLPDDSNAESEPNDSLAQADDIGALTAGASVTVAGSITQSGADTLDFFEFNAPTRIEVGATLTPQTGGADLQLSILDPVSLNIVRTFSTGGAGASANFVAKGTFFVLVESNSLDSDYELTLTGSALGSAIPEAEPNDTPAAGDYLGTISPGESLQIVADGSNGSNDSFVFAVPTGMTIDFTLFCAAGEDYDIDAYDATSGASNATFVQRFEASGDTETGQLSVTGMALVVLDVFPFGGATAQYTLDISVSANLTAGGFGGELLDPRPRASLASYAVQRPNAQDLFDATCVPFEIARGALIVKYKEGATRVAGPRVEDQAQPIAAMPGGPQKFVFDLPADLDDVEAGRYMLALAATLRGRADVEYAELDPWMEAFALPQGGEVRPNDTYYDLQWHYEQIGLPTAWNTTTGSAAIRVCVIDTGSAPCNDLNDSGGIDMISDAQIAGDGDGVDNDPTDVGDSNGVQPSSFHGAHVAGTVAAVSNNGYGVAGVAWDATVTHARVLGIGGGSSFDIANAVRWAAGLSNSSGQMMTPPAHIMNMSLGGGGFSQTLQDACTAAWDAGTVVIAAAGNENSSTPSFPAAYDDVISVSAVDFERNRAPYSNFHPTVDIAAPGGDVSVDLNGDGYADGVLSTKPDDSVTPTNFESFSFYQGTSMAAPHVAGVAALILSVDSALPPDQVESILRTTATDLGAAGHDNIYGDGLVNAAAAVAAAGNAGTGPVLGLDTSTVALEGTGTLSRTVGVSNVGTGTLSITNVTASAPVTGWLTASAIASSGGTTTDTSAIRVVANTTGLANGTYGGSVTVTSNGGSATINVSLLVGSTGTAVDYTVYVLAVEADALTTLAQDVIQTSGALGYALDGLDAGRYVIVAGTDEDNDGFICDEGEPLCGLYPSLGLATAIQLASGQRITGLNFPVQNAATPSSATGAGRQGFRLLPLEDDDVAPEERP